jgi:transcriptional regulator with PAS, ATPase and Fis domain
MDSHPLAFPSPQSALTPLAELPASAGNAGVPPASEGTEVHTFLGMPAVISSPAMRRLIAFVERVARANAAILITGESGTGKELIARAIHQHSMRCGRPWIDLNCAALPELLIESELFGYEKGAFSGALATKPGMFELAQTGSVFLDEIGDLPPRMQVKLLRVLDGAPYYRLGGTRKISVDARVIAATNQDLEQAMAAGSFRRDLYYRLAQVRVHVPPLRDRPDDVRPLARFFLGKQDPRLQLSERAMQALEQYAWPGNVRELRNVVVQAAVMADGDAIELEHLPFVVQSAPPRPVTLDDMEREMILKVMNDTGGEQQRTAEILGISLRTLSRKLKQYQEDGRRTQDQSLSSP